MIKSCSTDRIDDHSYEYERFLMSIFEVKPIINSTTNSMNRTLPYNINHVHLFDCIRISMTMLLFIEHGIQHFYRQNHERVSSAFSSFYFDVKLAIAMY
jgi:hypothetical protein